MCNVDEKCHAFFCNVRYFAKYCGDGKIGSVERYAGVAKGYLSRELAIPLNTALKMGEYLGIGLDDLTNPKARFDAEAKRAAQELLERESNKLKNTSINQDLVEKRKSLAMKEKT